MCVATCWRGGASTDIKLKVRYRFSHCYQERFLAQGPWTQHPHRQGRSAEEHHGNNHSWGRTLAGGVMQEGVTKQRRRQAVTRRLRKLTGERQIPSKNDLKHFGEVISTPLATERSTGDYACKLTVLVIWQKLDSSSRAFLFANLPPLKEITTAVGTTCLVTAVMLLLLLFLDYGPSPIQGQRPKVHACQALAKEY